MRCSFMSEDGYDDGDDDSGLGSSPIYPLVASSNAWSRFSGFFLSTLINLTICNIANNATLFLDDHVRQIRQLELTDIHLV